MMAEKARLLKDHRAVASPSFVPVWVYEIFGDFCEYRVLVSLKITPSFPVQPVVAPLL